MGIVAFITQPRVIARILLLRPRVPRSIVNFLDGGLCWPRRLTDGRRTP